MEQTFLTSLPLWLINLSLAGLVCAQAPRKAPHQAFAAYVLPMVLWSVSVKMAYITAVLPQGVWWARLAFIAAGCVGQSFIILCQVFPDQQRLVMTRGVKSILLLGCLVISLTFTPLVLRNIGVAQAGGVQPQYGPLYPLFGAFLLVAFGQGFWSLAQKWRAARGRSRQQIHYLWLGLGLTIGGGITTNLLIPFLTGSSRFSAYGPYFTLCFVGLTAHAIIRHRLMDIRLVIRQSVTYCLSLVATIAIMWGGLRFVEFVPGMQHFGASTFSLLIGIGGVVFFHPVRVRMQSLLDRYCFRTRYDYHLATRTISQVLAGLVRLTPLCTSLTAFIRSALGVEMVAVYVVRESTWLTQCASQSPNGDCILPQTVSIPGLLSLLTRAEEPVVREELGRWSDSREVKCLTTAFAALHSDVLIPLLVEDQLTALVAVGRKLSGDPFFVHDVEFLDTVGYQASVALRRAQLYEEIAWMKEYNDSILRQMVSGVIAVSQRGDITMVNAAAARLVGVAAEAVVGRVATESLPAALCTPLQQTLADGTTCTNEEATLALTARRKLPIALSTSVLHGAAGEQIGALLVFHDLSRLKELEEEKRRIERLAAVGTFVAGIAHEIKNPLVAIKTLAELLPEQYDDDEFRTTFTRVALHEVDRIDTLVQRLRSLGSSSPLQMRPINALTPLDETLALISGELAKRQVTLKYDQVPILPLIIGDHDQLKQVFLNLCLNSLEAMEQQGTLQIAVDMQAARDEMPAMLRIQISDTGPGISAEYFPTIFEPFVTSKATGSGLGLAICQGIIEHHRGTIAAANRLDGAGAIFTIRLPIAKEEEPYEIAAPVYGDTCAALAVA